MKKPVYAGAYQILDPINGECYVGGTANIEARWSAHRSLLKLGRHYCKRMQAAWQDHGRAFEWRVLEPCASVVETLTECEQRWMDALEPTYNNAPRARSNVGLKHSEETKSRHRELSTPEVMRARRALLVYPGHSAETRAKIGASKVGIPLSPERIAARQATRAANEIAKRLAMGLPAIKPPKEKPAPKPRSPEFREKLRLVNLGRKASAETRAKMSESAKQRCAERRAQGIKRASSGPMSPEKIAARQAKRAENLAARIAAGSLAPGARRY